MIFIRITRGNPGGLNSEGLEVLRMALWDSKGELASVPVYSGAPGAQNFRTLANERRGLLEPIPEGVYRNVGGLEWKNGEDNYNDYWSSSLGPVVIEVYGERAIMIHLDANRSYAPGSAGCICPLDFAGLKTVVGWWKNHKISHVECDWGLGTISKPNIEKTSLKKVKVFVNDGNVSVFQNDKEVKALELKLDYHSDKLGVSINKQLIDFAKIKNAQVIFIYE